MANPIRLITTGACLIGLAACAAPPQATPTAGLASTALPSASAAARATPFASIPLSESILVAQLDADSGSMAVSPVDPATGLRLPGCSPIDLGASFDYSFTPDGHTLIFIRYSSANPSRGELHFLDLGDWRDDFAILLLSANWTSALAISPDGAQLAVASAEPHGGGLWLVDTQRRVVLAHIHTDTLVTNMKFTADNESLMSYERNLDSDGSPGQGPPTVALRSALDLTAEWTRPLTMVRDGFQPTGSSGGSPFEPGAGSAFEPATIFAPAANFLYVVHADVAKLTRVDFDRRSVLTLDIRPLLAWLEYLLSLSATTAYAKGENGVQLVAQISRDGTVLYTDGVKKTVSQQTNGSSIETQAPLNLQAIRLKDAVQLFQSTAKGTSLDLSTDGDSLLVPQSNPDTGAVTGTIEVDAAHGAAAGQYPGLSLQYDRLMNGTPILVSSIQNSTGSPTVEMTAMTPDHRLLGSWTAPSYAEWLIMP